MMGNSELQYSARRGDEQQQQQVQNQTNGRERMGLMPTDGQDAYKRSSMRASRRSRTDRLSYLVALNKLDREEVKELCMPLGETSNSSIIRNDQNNNPNISQYSSDRLPANIMTTPMMPTNCNPQSIAGDQAFLDYVSSASLTPDNFKSNSNKIKKNLKVRMPTDNRNQFRRTRTEVTLPMKTSPAFEYILKDKGRRNRRCCLWFVYSTLMTIGLAIIVFCSIQLVQRYRIM